MLSYKKFEPWYFCLPGNKWNLFLKQIKFTAAFEPNKILQQIRLHTCAPISALLMGDPEITANLYCNFAHPYWEGCGICSTYLQWLLGHQVSNISAKVNPYPPAKHTWGEGTVWRLRWCHAGVPWYPPCSPAPQCWSGWYPTKFSQI